MKEARRVARTLGLLAFCFTVTVSLVVFYTADELTVVDWLLVLGAPPALGALFYFVGLHHDPEASD